VTKYNNTLSDMPAYRSLELMAARAFLRRPRMAALGLEEKRGRAAALEELAADMRAAWRIIPLRDGVRIAETLRSLTALREALMRDTLAYVALVRETEGLLRSCLTDERHRAVMEAHYLGFSTWEETADQVGYCPRHVKRLHKEALCLVAEHLREEDRLRVSAAPPEADAV
jgi:hypothetical protein